VILLPKGYGLTPPPATFTTSTATALLAWLLDVLLAWLLDVLLPLLALPLLALPLPLVGCGVHAGASAHRVGAGLVTIATHGGAGLFAL
jgi:hypothetical protein